jgi:hypothetical protein
LRLLGSLSLGNCFSTAGLANPERHPAETLARLFDDAMQRAVTEVLEV